MDDNEPDCDCCCGPDFGEGSTLSFVENTPDGDLTTWKRAFTFDGCEGGQWVDASLDIRDEFAPE